MSLDWTIFIFQTHECERFIVLTSGVLTVQLAQINSMCLHNVLYDSLEVIQFDIWLAVFYFFRKIFPFSWFWIISSTTWGCHGLSFLPVICYELPSMQRLLYYESLMHHPCWFILSFIGFQFHSLSPSSILINH